MKKRTAKIERITKETKIKLSLNLDGEGSAKVSTGIAFFDHMLTLWTKHGQFDLDLKATGDLEVDFHHSVEDIGICLGEAFKQALGTGEKINRFSWAIIPMDEAKCEIALDLANRPTFCFKESFPKEKTGDFDAELVNEFFQAFVNNARISLHLEITTGQNLHHMIEACFKAFGIALSKAAQINPQKKGIPSTKGVL